MANLIVTLVASVVALFGWAALQRRVQRRRMVARRLSLLDDAPADVSNGPGWGWFAGWMGEVADPRRIRRAIVDGLPRSGPLAAAIGGIALVLGLGYGMWVTHRSGLAWGLLGGGALAASGAWLANRYVTSRARRRQEAIAWAVPDAVERIACLLAVGTSLESAIGAIARDARRGDRFLKAELFRYLQETRLGRTRQEALVELAQRCEVPELDRMVGALLTARDDASMRAQLRQCALALQAEWLEKKRVRARRALRRTLWWLVGCFGPMIVLALRAI